MKHTILTRDIQLSKIPEKSGRDGYLIIEQDEVGGHLVSLPEGDIGFVSVALNAGAITEVHWSQTDGKVLWSSIKMTSDVIIENPSAITGFVVEIIDTVSAKIKWNAPQGFNGNDSSSADIYYIILSSSPIDPAYAYEAIRLKQTPLIPGTPETFIVSNLTPGMRYYVAMYSEKQAYGKTRKSELSNVATFFTTPLDGNETVPKRIPISADRIYEPLLHINFADGELFTNYPSFKRLADQSYIIDNNGMPEGVPELAIVSAYQSYGTLQPSWYNVGSYDVIFELDGTYDLDYIAIIAQNNNRFSIFTSGDGVTKFKAFDKSDTPIDMSGWTKIPLNEGAKTNIRFIILSLYVGDEWFNGFVPYGTRKNVLEIVGEKYKKLESERTLVEAIGTNAFLAENQYDLIGKVSKIGRLYNNSDWVMADRYKQQQNQSDNPDDIEMVSALSHMWNYDLKLKEMLDEGQKELVFTLVSWPVYLRATGIESAINIKPIDPGLNYRDLAVTTNPQSYKHMARIVASMAYRWGFNPDAPEVCNQFIENDGKKALGLVRYYEMGNEIDRTWHGDNAFFHPFEFGALLSALYDGHKNTMGPGMGIRSADPTAKLVMPGLISINSDFVYQMLLWFDLYRGKGDYPIDVLNFHHYNAYRFSTDTPTWSNIPAYGVPPEAGNLIHETKEFLRINSLFAPDKESWVSEFGYDEQYGGKHSPPDRDAVLRGRHKAIWILRSELIYMSLGMDAACHYWYAGDTVRLIDLNPNIVQREEFYTSGLFDGVTWAGDRNRVPLQAAWFVMAFVKAMTGYTYSHSIMEAGVLMISEDNIILNYHPNLWAHAFTNEEGEAVIVAWLGVGNWATFNMDIRINNDINALPTVDFVKQDERLSESGAESNIQPMIAEVGKHVFVPLTETPIIIKSSLVGTGLLKPAKNIKSQSITATSIKLAWTDENIGTPQARIYSSIYPDRDFVIVEQEYRDDAETTLVGLLPDTTYYYRVQFVDGGRISKVSDVVSGVTLFVLDAPTNLVQSSATASTVTLGWEYPVQDEGKISNFIIYRSLVVNGEYNEVGRVAANIRQFRDIGLIQSTAYYYKVRSYKDGVVSNFTFNVAASTVEPSLEPPTILSGTIHPSGSYIDLIFNEELKDEQTALIAFSIIERFASGELISHPVSTVSIGQDKTKVRLNFYLPIFKNSSATISYSANLGFLKSIYNVPVNTFSSFALINNVADLYSPIVGWSEIAGITINRNNLTGNSGGGRAVAQVKVLAGATAVVQFSTDAQNSMLIGLDANSDPEGFNTMDYYISKQNGVLDYKRVSIVSSTSVQFTVGVVRYRLDGVNINFEVSYDNGLSFVTFATSPQPPIDLFIKVYTNGAPEKVLNLVGRGLSANEGVIIPEPPTAMLINDGTDEIDFDLSPGYSIEEHEYSTNYLTLNPVYSPVVQKPVMVGDVNIPVGGLAIRVKEATGRAASQPLLNTVALTGSINTSSKIMVQKSSGGTVLFSSNSLDDVKAWLAQAVITEPLTVQFNTSDIYYVPEVFGPTYQNGVHWITFKGAAGVRPVFDAQRVASSVWRCEQNYTILQNLELRNGDIENLGGAMLRADTRNNMKFLDLIFDYGYCGCRATTGCYNFEIDNIIVRNTKEGSFRLGNDVTIDQSNISIKNIKFDDPTNGGFIENTTYRYYGGFALKVTDGLTLENVGPLSGDRLFDIGVIENSKNVTLKNVRGSKVEMQGDDGVTMINTYLPESSYVSQCRNLTILHSLLNLNLTNSGKLLKIRGSVFPKGFFGTILTAADAPNVEDNNVFVADISGNYINLYVVETSTGNPVNDANLAAYKLTHGLNSIFIPYANRASLNLNPFGSLRGNSLGKRLITGVIEEVTYDTYNSPRTYPTDPGPFSGSRPDVNDVPVAPTLNADNLTRILSASHPLGTSEIVFSFNGGLFQAYAGLINVGDTALPEGSYVFKIKSAPYRDESPLALSPAFTEKPEEGNYQVLRTIEVNVRSEYCDSSPESNINEYFGSGDNPIGGTTLSKALIDKTGATTGITLSNFEQGFDGAACTVMPTGVYIREEFAIRSGVSINKSTPSKLKLTGLLPDKFYQFYIVAGTDEGNAEARYKIGNVATTKVVTGNYPLAANGDMYSNPAVIRIKDIVSDVNGEVIIEITKIGSSYQQAVLSYLIIEETNEAKPV